MPSPKQKLITRSRDRDFLLRTALVIGGLGLLSGLVVDKLRPRGPDIESLMNRMNVCCPWTADDPNAFRGEDADIAKLVKLFAERLSQPLTPDDVADMVREDTYVAALDFDIPNKVVPLELHELFWAYGIALHGAKQQHAGALKTLRTAAVSEPPPRFANEFYGHLLARKDDDEAALKHFRRELEISPKSDFSRRGEVDALLALERSEELAPLLGDAGFAEAVGGQRFEDAAIATGSWGKLVAWHAHRIVTRNSAIWLVVTAFAAGIWWVIVAALGRLERFRSGRAGIYYLALASGFLSTFVVLGVVIWQERVLGLTQNGDLANDLIYCISGIGLREELIKLLFFAPLLPVLLKRKSSMEALAAGACVGVGFAAAENLIYFGPGAEGGMFPRFLTANFFHAALTGIASLALFHFARWPKTRWEEFIGTFVAVIVAHGMYDALAGLVPQLADQFQIFAIIIFAVTANYFLARAREVREGGPAAVSPLGVFVVGAALLVAIAWNLACWTSPLRDVMRDVGQNALKLGALAFLFINQFRNE